jgi:hypothetical protein
VKILVNLSLDTLQIFIQPGEKRVLLVKQVFCGTLEGQCWGSLAKVQAGKQ